MSDDTDSPPEREMKDFQFRQMKKARVFEPAEELPKERSNLLTISNKFGLTFVALGRTFKVYLTHDILNADKAEGTSNEIVEGIAALAEVTVQLTLHHLALSCDELTLSICGMNEEAGLSLTFYDVRTFMNKAKSQKLPFASLLPPVPPGTLVQDLKWNPAHPSKLALCMSDGSMQILDVADSAKVLAELPASSGITCVCWSPKGKQVAAGKMNATVSQYTPTLEEKKVIPCPHFYTTDEPVKVLDVLWLKTFVFAVVYAAADGSLETPPELVFISLPKKDEKVETNYLNFGDTVYGSCTERQHHYFLSHVEDWDLVFAASAASIEVSVIARQEDKIWELWILEDASRAELPVTESDEDNLPLGLAIDYTSQQEIRITDEKTLPPVPTMLMLSTEGLLCPFALLNFNPGVKQLVSAPTTLAVEGERLPKPGSLVSQPPKSAALVTSALATFPNLGLTAAASTLPAPAASVPAASVPTAPFSIAPTTIGPVSSSSSFVFSVPTTFSTPTVSSSTPFCSGSTGFSFAPKPLTDTPSAPSAFLFSPSIKPAAVATTASALVQSTAAPSPPTVKLNLNERFSALETTASQPFSFNSSVPKTVTSSTSVPTLPLTATKPSAVLAPVRPIQPSTPSTIIQKPAPAVAAAAQGRVQTPQAAVSVKSLEKQLQEKKDSDPIMAGILEEIAHFQKELDDLKARSASADFKVGATEEMKELRKESEDLHIFTLEIKETTESLHGDINTLNTTLLEGFAGAEEANTQTELRRDRNYRQLLYKKPLDPRSEEQLKEIRRLYQYVMFAVDDVNDALDAEWEKHLEKKKKQKHMVVPGRENLYTTLANNQYIIKRQKTRLDHLVKELTSLRLYNKTAAPTNHSTARAAGVSLENELESLRNALLEARLESTPPKAKSKSPTSKISPVKLSQLRNFLSKGQMPPIRSTAPANLSRSAFLSPKYYEDLDDVSSTSSLSQSLEPHAANLDVEEEELQPEAFPPTVIPPTLSTPRHPTVVRTPSIQPGFGAIQSTPLTKIQSGPGVAFGLSPIPSPVPANKISLSGADSTALATKTVKHGAPPTERTVPVTISAQQAAATAALRRQMANQKTAVVSTSLTESTLKTVPQVVNVQELKEKEPPAPVSNIIRAVGFGFSSVTQGSQVKDANKFSFGNGKMVFGQTGGETPAIGTAASTVSPNTSAEKITPSTTALKLDPQLPKAIGGETLGSFSGLRVGPGEEAKDSSAKPAAASYSFADPGVGMSKGVAQFSFGAILPKAAEDSTGTDLSKGAASGSLFKPPESNPKPAFSVPQSSSAASTLSVSFSSLLAAPSDSSEVTKAPPQPSEPTPPPEKERPAEPAVDVASPLLVPEPAAENATTETTAPIVTAPAPHLPSIAPTPDPSSSLTSPNEAPPPPPATTAPTIETTLGSTTTTTSTVPASAAAAPSDSQVAPTLPGSLFSQPASMTKESSSLPVSLPGSVFTKPTIAATNSGSFGVTPVICTVAPAATTTTLVVTSSTSTAPAAATPVSSVFGQPTAPPVSSAPSALAAPVSTAFGSAGFGASAGSGFGKPVFAQSSGFGQPATNTGTASGFTFGVATFGASSNSATTGGGLFGASTPSSAISFSFGTGSTNTASSTGTGVFGQSTAHAFGQSSGFGQGPAFGNNTTTSSSTGFSFGQPSAFGCSSAFGQQPSSGALFGQQQPSSGGNLFGTNSGNAGGSAAGGGFFSGLGGKPSEVAANKNPFGTAAATGGFGQSSGTNNLFGNSGAKAFSFGQSSFGEQKSSGTFSAGTGSVASQGFGSFSTPTKPGGFGSAPVFGSPPSFGSSPSFGNTASFGTSPAFSNTMGPSSGKVFGEGTAASSMGGFGFASPPSGPSFGSLANQNPPTFGSLAQQGSGFGSQPSSFSGFGQQPQAGGFSGGTFGSSNQSNSQTFSSWRS